ncbi:Ankyrin repeat protein [Beauveria bassiana ARSEF 2860]|uniref:Ankyrin repeat protein n=1 Tax=Beauveria bassiana (strain ARSEF 2860) TaxID=655819 RepID=J4WF77_BEAB2|nr:Ankyrin repeat protein [Beauveria bassiana ARSEF 2860]EJP68615.1 Ankyrin repeat protein [Beauveria bassiana ARSEF 2860]
MHMSSQQSQLAKTKTTISKDDAVANKEAPCSWSRCPDHILQVVAGFLNNRSDINRLVRTNRQCHRAVNKFLYKFDLRDDGKLSYALLWACCLSKVETARMALEAGADPNTEYSASLWEVLDKYSPDFDPSRGISARNALYVVASFGDVAMARFLIEFAQADFSKPVRYPTQPSGACLCQSVRYEDPPLFSAISADCAELLHVFLQQYGYNIRDLSNSTVLARAVREKRPAAIRTILSNESFSDPLGAGDINGLIQAVYQGDAGLVRLILAKSRSDPNVIRNRGDDNRCHGGIYGQTPLVVAVCHGHESVVRALCADSRVDINLAGPNHRAPIFYALTQFRWDIVDVLVAHGATYDAELAFEQACINRQLAWMLRLIQTTTFDETRLDYWYKTSYALLNECNYWQMVQSELNQQKRAFLRSWRQDNALLWEEHAIKSIKTEENGGS